MPAGELSLLVVCVGNVCRSPAAQLALQQRLGPDSGIRVESAGVRALVGEPVEQRTANVLRANGVDTDGFAARQLEPAHLERADVVLAMTRELRGTTARTHPPVVRRLWTLRELARLLGTVEEAQLPVDVSPAERLRAAVELSVVSRRHFAPPFHDDDVADPYGRDDGAHKAAWRHVDQALQVLLRAALGDVKSPSHRTS
ncbi:arsenate reductase/protein-tyrosine-phosphatase family protein [Angustibacter aerolatus]